MKRILLSVLFVTVTTISLLSQVPVQITTTFDQDCNSYYNIPQTIIGNKVFFKVNYDELWVSDGTSGGSMLLKDFNMSNWSIGNFIAFNNELFFTAQLNGNGTNLELWKSDGTIGGTQQVAVLGHDCNNYFDIVVANVNSKIFFKVNYDQLWVSDGTTGGTQLLKDFNMSSFAIGNFFEFNNTLLLTGQLNGNGANLELWKSDGSVGGTQQVAVIGHDCNNYFDFTFANVNNKVFFKVNYDILWVSDGTTGGTQMLKDFNMSTYPISNYIVLNNEFLFTAQLNGNGTNLELWKSDGTVAGTQQVKVIGQVATSYSTIPYVIVNNKVFLKINYDELWVSDGTSGGSMLLKDFNMSNWSIGNFISFNNELFFTAQLNGNGTNLELWKSDGTVGGTQQVAVLGHDCNNYFNIVVANINSKIFFKVNYDHLWVSDGTTGGTQLLKDFNMSTYSIGNFIDFNNTLLLTGQLNGNGANLELWKSDGTVGGTQLVKVIGQVSTNYTTIPYAIVNNNVLFKINYDVLWRCDGTTAGTQQLKDFNMSNWSIGNFTTLGNTLLLTAQENGNGAAVDLWALVIPTLISDITEPVTFSIYPVPANDYLNISLTEKIVEASYYIFNLEGKIIQEGVFDESRRIQFSSNMPQGCYFIGVRNNYFSDVKKFLIVK